MEQLSFQYSGIYFAVCLLAGLIFAAALYYRENRFERYSNTYLWLMALLRFLIVAGLGLFLLQPFFKQIDEEIKKPIVVTLIDDSQSIAKASSEDAQTSFNNDFSALNTALGEQYDHYAFRFASNVTASGDTSATDTQVTNLSQALEYVYDNYNDQNLGAVILASDGIFNEGQSPIYQSLDFKSPIHTIGLGDTTTSKDVAVQYVYYNKIAYLNDQFGIQVDVSAAKARGSQLKLSISEEVDGKFKKIKDLNVPVDKNDFFSTKDFVLNANRPGIIKYRVNVSGINGEQNKGNNRFDFYVEVLDSRMKIKILAAAPHPDIAALKSMLENNKNYEIETVYARDFKSNSANGDFVIFHDLPNSKNDLSGIVKSLDARKTPRAFVVGRQTNLALFNKLQNTLNISGSNAQTNEVQAVLNPSFNLFNLEENLVGLVPRLVPLLAPFGEYQTGPKTEVFAYQKIGTVDTKYPLIAFSENNQQKTLVIAAEGIWRWKLVDFAQNGSFDVVNDLLDKSIGYTSVKEDRRKFQVSCAKNVFKQNEAIQFDAELYNSSYQRINDPESFLVIKNSAGKEFDFVFSKTSDAYELNAGFFEAGRYSYIARCSHNGERHEVKGNFSVQAIQLELNQLTADHNLLRNLSEQYGGQFYSAQSLSNLQDDLLTTNKLKPVVYATSRTMSVLNLKWLFFILFALLGIEWFMRRYFGSY